jgi:hypothetical protein
MQGTATPRGKRSIAASVRHQRLGVALTDALVVAALALSICAVLVMIGIGAATSAPA